MSGERAGDYYSPTAATDLDVQAADEWPMRDRTVCHWKMEHNTCGECPLWDDCHRYDREDWMAVHAAREAVPT